MAKVYRVGSIWNTEYFNTSKDANRCKPGGEEPESIVCVDAAGECNRLNRAMDEADRTIAYLRLILEELRDACPVEVIHNTETGRRVNKYIENNPLPPATASDRDGQRSYGGG